MNRYLIIWSSSSSLAVLSGSHKGCSRGDLKSIVGIIGEVEVRIIEGNCVDGHKVPREVNIARWRPVLLQ